MNTVCIVVVPEAASPIIPRFLFHEPLPPSLPETTPPNASDITRSRSRAYSDAPSAISSEKDDHINSLDGWDEGEVPPKEYYRSVMEREFAIANQLQKITLQTGISATLQLAQRSALAKLEKEKREKMTEEFLLQQNPRALDQSAPPRSELSASLQSESTAAFKPLTSVHESQLKRRKNVITESEAAAGVTTDKWADVRPSVVNPVFNFGIPLEHTPQLSCWVNSFSVIRHECSVNTVLTATPASSARSQLGGSDLPSTDDDAGRDLLMRLGFSQASLEDHSGGSGPPSARSHSRIRGASYTVAKSLALRRSLLDDVCHYGSLHSSLYSVLRQSVTSSVWDVGADVSFLIHGDAFQCSTVGLLRPGGVLDALLCDVIEESSRRQIADVFGVELSISASLIDSKSGNVVDLCPASVQGGQPLKVPVSLPVVSTQPSPQHANRPNTMSELQPSGKRLFFYSPLSFSDDEGGPTSAGGAVSGFKSPHLLASAPQQPTPTNPTNKGTSSKRRGKDSEMGSTAAPVVFLPVAAPPPYDPLANETLVKIDPIGDHYCELRTDKIRRQRRAFFSAERLRQGDMASFLSCIETAWMSHTEEPEAASTEIPPPEAETSRVVRRTSMSNRSNSLSSLIPSPQNSTSTTPAATPQASAKPPPASNLREQAPSKWQYRSNRDTSAMYITISLTKKCTIMAKQTSTIRLVVLRNQPEVVGKLLTTATTRVPLHHTVGDFTRTLAHILPLKAPLDDLPKRLVFIAITPIARLPDTLPLLAAAKGLSDGPNTHLDHATQDVIKAVDTFKEEKQTLARAHVALQQDNSMYHGKLRSIMRRIKQVEGHLKAKVSKCSPSSGSPRAKGKAGSADLDRTIPGAATSTTTPLSATLASPTRRASRGRVAISELMSTPDTDAVETASSAANVSVGRQNCTVTVNNEEYTFMSETVSDEAAAVLVEIEELRLKIEALERDGGEALRKGTRDNNNLADERDELARRNASLRKQRTELTEKLRAMELSDKLAADHLRKRVLEDLERNARLIGINRHTLYQIIEETSNRSLVTVGLINPTNPTSESANTNFEAPTNLQQKEVKALDATAKSGIRLGPLVRRPKSSSISHRSRLPLSTSAVSKSAAASGNSVHQPLDSCHEMSVASPWPDSAPLRVPFVSLPPKACVNSTGATAPAPVETEDSIRLRELMKSYLESSRDMHLKQAAAEQSRSKAFEEAMTAQRLAQALKSVLLQYTSTICSPSGKSKYPQLSTLLNRRVVQGALEEPIPEVDEIIKHNDPDAWKRMLDH